MFYLLLLLTISIIVLTDYHSWYRTNTGEWANKHGYLSGTPSVPLGTDIPTTQNSSGWSLGEISCFYNSDIIYYIITE